MLFWLSKCLSLLLTVQALMCALALGVLALFLFFLFFLGIQRLAVFSPWFLFPSTPAVMHMAVTTSQIFCFLVNFSQLRNPQPRTALIKCRVVMAACAMIVMVQAHRMIHVST